MDTLKAVQLCALLVASAPTQPCGPVTPAESAQIDRWQSFIDAASQKFNVPTDWIRAVMARESAGLAALHKAPIMSGSGAMGLMQLMPGTWSDMRARYGLGNDPFDPHDNIFAGAAYLREMFDRYGYPDLFAAYNAGPGRLDKALEGQKSLPEITQSYLESIVPGAKAVIAAKPGLPSDMLFFVHVIDRNTPEHARDPSPTTRGLFVPLAMPRERSRFLRALHDGPLPGLKVYCCK